MTWIAVVIITPVAFLVGLGVARGEIQRLREENAALRKTEAFAWSVLLGVAEQIDALSRPRADLDRVVAQVLEDEGVEAYRLGRRVEGIQ
jgi:hypothetical protein